MLNVKTLKATFSDEFLSEIPKADIHVHLDGSVRLTTLMELAHEQGVPLPFSDPTELQTKLFNGKFSNLGDYLKGFAITTAIMQDAVSIERISYEFAVDNYSEGVRYFEVRFAPQLHATIDPSLKFNLMEVISAVNDGLKRAKDEWNNALNLSDPLGPPIGSPIGSPRDDTISPRNSIGGPTYVPRYDYGIIVCAMRSFFPGMSRYYDAFFAVHSDESTEKIAGLASEILVNTALKCRDVLKIPVVAIDIAGAEDGYQAEAHSNAFEIAHSKLLCKTVHAGEGFGPESIYQAVKDLHADRIGHGYHLFSKDLIVNKKNIDDADFINRLVKYICDRRICLEVCLSSNLDTMPDLKLGDHAFRHMLEHNVCVSLNTDNRLVSNTTMVKELRMAVDAFDLTPKKLREIVINGFKRSFFHGSYNDRRKYVRQMMNYYDSICLKHGVPLSG